MRALEHRLVKYLRYLRCLRFAISSAFVLIFNSKVSLADTSLYSTSLLDAGTVAMSQMKQRLSNKSDSLSFFVAALSAIHIHFLLVFFSY
ncbi:unnamed protein product [Soboliphyme baturini]|uniref:Secreted protein n=1 Tax=Soboliphyme baturini TaxID=241478 RepID=A0A183J6A0_9BILA|nr:unnamed protein product [Soboliphyme baturini]